MHHLNYKQQLQAFLNGYQNKLVGFPNPTTPQQLQTKTPPCEIKLWKAATIMDQDRPLEEEAEELANLPEIGQLLPLTLSSQSFNELLNDIKDSEQDLFSQQLLSVQAPMEVYDNTEQQPQVSTLLQLGTTNSSMEPHITTNSIPLFHQLQHPDDPSSMIAHYKSSIPSTESSPSTNSNTFSPENSSEGSCSQNQFRLETAATKRQINIKQKKAKTCKKGFRVCTSPDEIETVTLDDGRIKCVPCNKIFARPCYATQHNKSFHSGEFRYKCETCGKHYKEDQEFKTHVAKHTATEKEFKCGHCPKQFCHKTDLRRHVEGYHMEIKPHTCGSCGKGFCRRDHLRKHMETHEKPRAGARKNKAANIGVGSNDSL